jgi:hypothetical protein
VLVVCIGHVGYWREAASALEALSRRRLHRVEDLCALDAFKIDQVVEARLVDVERVDLPGTDAAAARAPANAELGPVRLEAKILRPLRRLELLELRDLFRDLRIGRMDLGQGKMSE